MNTERAWDHFVRQVMNVAGGIEEPTRAIAAGKLYAAHAVAEARAPLVEILEDLQWQAHDEPYGGADLDPPITSVTVFSCPECGGLMDIGHFGDCPLAAALAAKETP